MNTKISRWNSEKIIEVVNIENGTENLFFIALYKKPLNIISSKNGAKKQERINKKIKRGIDFVCKYIKINSCGAGSIPYFLKNKNEIKVKSEKNGTDRK